MPLEFKLPELGEGVTEGEIISWKVEVGDSVVEDQPLVEVMTDKATVEIPAPGSGTVEAIHAEAGAIVPVGSVIVVIGGGSGASAPPAPDAATTPPAPAPAPAPAPQPTVAVAPAPVAPVPAPVRAHQTGAAALATPATRRLARELGIEIDGVVGSGPRGRVTKDDVRAAANGTASVGATAGPAATSAAATAAAPVRPIVPGEITRIPYRGLRKAIGDQMVKSLFTAPHFTVVEEVDMTVIDGLRRGAKDRAAAEGVKLTFLPFIMKSLCAALRRHPTLNSSLDEAAGEQIVYPDIHIGVALDTERGLMVPVIRNAHVMSVMELAAELQRLSERGHAGTITREELTGSTITITSAGSIGGLFATPIINYPEVAIVGIYRIEDRPVVIDGEIVVRKMMYFSATLDHRVVDGGEAVRFQQTLRTYLADPARLVIDC